MSGEEETPPINDEDTSKSVSVVLYTPKIKKNRSHFFFTFTFLTSPAGLFTWNYYVNMPMPASTFTLAVGHWQQIPAEIPPESGEGVGEGVAWGKTANLGAGPRHWTEAEFGSGLGSSTGKVVTGSLQNIRYFIDFPIYEFFSSQLNVALQYSTVKLFFKMV